MHLATRLESGNHKQLVNPNRLCLSSTNRMAPASSEAAQHAKVRTQSTESKAVNCCICQECASCQAHNDGDFCEAFASHLWRLCSHNPVSLPKPICGWPMLTTLTTMTSQHGCKAQCALHKSLGFVCALASLPRINTRINTHTHTTTAERRLWTETEKGRI